MYSCTFDLSVSLSGGKESLPEPIQEENLGAPVQAEGQDTSVQINVGMPIQAKTPGSLIQGSSAQTNISAPIQVTDSEPDGGSGSGTVICYYQVLCGLEANLVHGYGYNSDFNVTIFKQKV